MVQYIKRTFQMPNPYVISIELTLKAPSYSQSTVFHFLLMWTVNRDEFTIWLLLLLIRLTVANLVIRKLKNYH